MLYNRRKRLEEIAKAEAAGQSFWTTQFDEAVRNKIFHALEDTCRDYTTMSECLETARALILRDEGIRHLVYPNVNEAGDMEYYLTECTDEMMPTTLEALTWAVATNRSAAYREREFQDSIRQILREHRIAFDLVNREMVPFSSRELHTSVVAPTIHLVSTSPEWSNVESSYSDALREISAGKPADAITDAGTALQQTLEQLGCEGNALGPLIKSARRKGLLASHDSPLIDAIERALHWVSADRSERGDAHLVSRASIEDAWLTVHIVGAIILRLSKGPR